MKNSQKGFIVPLIIAIVAITLIAGGSYIYVRKHSAGGTTAVQPSNVSATTTASSTTADPFAIATSSSLDVGVAVNKGPVQLISTTTANLTRYTNTDFGFSIDYPKAWSVPVVSTKNSNLDVSISNSAGTDGLHIQALPSSAKFTEQQFVWSDWGHASTTKFVFAYIGAKPAVKYDYVSAVGGKYVRTIQFGFDTANGSFVSLFYTRTFNTEAAAKSENMAEADQLASEVQFY